MRYVVAALQLCLLMTGTSPVMAETGIASVYSVHDKDQTGTKTASGIPLNDRAASMAHKSLPLGSYATVTNLANGKSLSLRVTDRGPYVHGRIVDLSIAAAILLGCPGLCRVNINGE